MRHAVLDVPETVIAFSRAVNEHQVAGPAANG